MIIAAALHAQDSSPVYPLAGIIFSGWGIRPAPDNIPFPKDASEKLTWKRLIMCGKPELDLVPREALDALVPQDQHMTLAEVHEAHTGVWQSYWRSYSDEITIPVMFGQPEHDLFWEGTIGHVKEIEMCFPKSERFDGSLVLNAPHAIEWSYCAAGWYARCFGFALEVTTSHALRRRTAQLGK